MTPGATWRERWRTRPAGDRRQQRGALSAPRAGFASRAQRRRGRAGGGDARAAPLQALGGATKDGSSVLSGADAPDLAPDGAGRGHAVQRRRRRADRRASRRPPCCGPGPSRPALPGPGRNRWAPRQLAGALLARSQASSARREACAWVPPTRRTMPPPAPGSARAGRGPVRSVGMRGLDGAPQSGNASRGCRSGLVKRRQNEVTANKQPALALAA